MPAWTMPKSIWSARRRAAARDGPGLGQRQRVGGGRLGGREVQADVQRHDDVRAERFLGATTLSGVKKSGVPSRCERKRDAIGGHLAQRRQTPDLEAAAVREQRTIPAHEAVEPAEAAHGVRAGPQRQVVSVGEHARGAQRA